MPRLLVDIMHGDEAALRAALEALAIRLDLRIGFAPNIDGDPRMRIAALDDAGCERVDALDKIGLPWETT